MNAVKIFKALVVFIVTFLIGVVLHTSVFGNLTIGVVTPNVLLLITAAFGFMNGSIWGMCFGFFSGLVVDCFSPDYFGLNCLLYLFIGFLNGLFTRVYYGEDIRLPLLLIGSSDVLYGSVVYMFLFLVRQRFDYIFYFLNIIMPEAMYTVIVFILLYYPLLRAFRWYHKEGTRNFV